MKIFVILLDPESFARYCGRPKTAYQFEAAQKFIDATYPNLRGRPELQKDDVDILPTTASCGGGGITIPIYIPRGK